MAEPGYQLVYHRRRWNENLAGCFIARMNPVAEESAKLAINRDSGAKMSAPGLWNASSDG